MTEVCPGKFPIRRKVTDRFGCHICNRDGTEALFFQLRQMGMDSAGGAKIHRGAKFPHGGRVTPGSHTGADFLQNLGLLPVQRHVSSSRAELPPFFYSITDL